MQLPVTAGDVNCGVTKGGPEVLSDHSCRPVPRSEPVWCCSHCYTNNCVGPIDISVTLVLNNNTVNSVDSVK